MKKFIAINKFILVISIAGFVTHFSMIMLKSQIGDDACIWGAFLGYFLGSVSIGLAYNWIMKGL